MEPRILIAEDDDALGAALVQALENNGYSVERVGDGVEADRRWRAGGYDGVILDLGLPGRDGLDVLQAARRAGFATPVLVLTARDQPDDRVTGLDAGADDYLVKPFHLAELLARLRALLRRGAGHAAELLRHGDLALDEAGRQASFRGRQVDLTPSELKLLALLMRRPGAVATREQLEAVLQQGARTVGSNTLDVYVHRLRRKLAPEVIRTVHGVGYCLEPGGSGQ